MRRAPSLYRLGLKRLIPHYWPLRLLRTNSPIPSLCLKLGLAKRLNWPWRL
nr:MAG TPA: hypothetical protein [Caudoviricetes sp.]